MTSTPQPSTSDTADAAAWIERFESGHRRGQQLLGAALLLPRLVFAVLHLAASAPAAMATPLLRQRMGLLALLSQVPLGLFCLLICAGLAHRSPLTWGLLAWVTILLGTAGVQFVRAVIRLYAPETPHVARWSAGEPRPLLARLWALLLGTRASNPRWVALCGEPLLLIALSMSLLMLEIGFIIAGVQDRPVVFLAPMLAGFGTAAQAAVLYTRDAYQVAVMLDAEQSQAELASALTKHAAAPQTREIDGVASIPAFA